MLRRPGLGGRLAVAFALLAVVVTAVVSLTSLASTRGEVLDDVDKFLEERADDIASGRRGEPPDRNRDARPGVDQEGVARAVDNDAEVQILDDDGEVIDTIGVPLPVEDVDLALVRNPEADKVLRTVDIDGVEYRMITEHIPGGGAVQVAQRLDSADAIISAVETRTVVLGLLLAAGAGAIGWFVAQATTAPLRRLTRSVEQVAQTQDLDQRVAMDRSDEVGRLARTFDEMLAALDTSRRQQTQLVQDAAHELRTPLTSIRANIDLLVRAPDIEVDERQEMLGRVRSELGQLSTVITEIVELATDSRDTEAHVELDLAAVADAAATTFTEREGRPVELHAVPIAVRGDRAALERAIGNLLGNAAKFAPTGSISLTVDRGTVTVLDEGPGIPVAELELIFDRFHRTSATRHVPGSGLGLAIVSKIAAEHGGTVFARNRREGGAAIGFSLPTS
ncbi:MAG: HAMP domain-containing sensor histidine kinase [Actinomycetota bacterium]